MRQAWLVGLVSIVLTAIYQDFGLLQIPNLKRIIYHSAASVVLSDEFLVYAADWISVFEDVVSCALWSVIRPCTQ